MLQLNSKLPAGMMDSAFFEGVRQAAKKAAS
jgi:hypothetical protein